MTEIKEIVSQKMELEMNSLNCRLSTVKVTATRDFASGKRRHGSAA